ncbi:hypothetical protein [Escherichia coli]|uniref:hypothetical protein n=1 Tax=Escherichia coli TaxID=562 RepID=UPI00388E0626
MLTGMMSDYLGVVFWLFLALGIVAALRALWFLMAQIGFAAWAVPLIVSATAFFTAGFLHEKAAPFRAMSGGADTSFWLDLPCDDVFCCDILRRAVWRWATAT